MELLNSYAYNCLQNIIFKVLNCAELIPDVESFINQLEL